MGIVVMSCTDLVEETQRRPPEDEAAGQDEAERAGEGRVAVLAVQRVDAGVDVAQDERAGHVRPPARSTRRPKF